MVGFRMVALVMATVVLVGCQSMPVAVMTGSSLVGPSLSSPGALPVSSALQEGAGVDAPSGFLDFCRRNPRQCPTAKPARITLDLTLWQSLARVNDAWNSAVKPMDDDVHYGRADYWTIPIDGYGDCEDYVLGKRHTLMEQGIPAGALSIALVRTREGLPHAVLIVHADTGDYVLDSAVSDILPWQSTSYRWVAWQVAGEHWAAIITNPTMLIASGLR